MIFTLGSPFQMEFILKTWKTNLLYVRGSVLMAFFGDSYGYAGTLQPMETKIAPIFNQ